MICLTRNMHLGHYVESFMLSWLVVDVYQDITSFLLDIYFAVFHDITEMYSFLLLYSPKCCHIITNKMIYLILVLVTNSIRRYNLGDIIGLKIDRHIKVTIVCILNGA